MTPITMLREGIQDGDWDSVVAGYRALTGNQDVKAPNVDKQVDKIVQISFYSQEQLRKLADQIQLALSTVLGDFSNTLRQTIEDVIVKQKTNITPAGTITGGSLEDHNDPTQSTDDVEDEHLVISDDKSGTTQFISGPEDSEQKALNQKIASKKLQLGVAKRRPPKKHKGICSICKQEYESDIPVPKGGDIGAMCPKCLKGKPRSRD